MDLTPDVNYHHLLSFWAVAREGSVSRAGDLLGVGQPTVSAQVKELERALRQPLVARDGRGLRLTDAGRVTFDYADEIFRLGRELTQAVRGGAAKARPARVAVGVAEVVPKLLVYRLLEPVYAGPAPVHLVCVEDRPEKLLADLALYNLDLVITDSQVTAGARVKAYHHPLGECGVTFFAARPLADALRPGFPDSLDGAPFLLPTDVSSLRRGLDQWFAARKVRPDVRGEFADSALVKVFGQAGRGVFALPSAVEPEVRGQYEVDVVGRTDAVRERFYAVTVDRKLTHPAVVTICETARQELFTAPAGGR